MGKLPTEVQLEGAVYTIEETENTITFKGYVDLKNFEKINGSWYIRLDSTLRQEGWIPLGHLEKAIQIMRRAYPNQYSPSPQGTY